MNPKEIVFDFDFNVHDKFSMIATLQDSEEHGY